MICICVKKTLSLACFLGNVVEELRTKVHQSFFQSSLNGNPRGGECSQQFSGVGIRGSVISISVGFSKDRRDLFRSCT